MAAACRKDIVVDEKYSVNAVQHVEMEVVENPSAGTLNRMEVGPPFSRNPVVCHYNHEGHRRFWSFNHPLCRSEGITSQQFVNIGRFHHCLPPVRVCDGALRAVVFPAS